MFYAGDKSALEWNCICPSFVLHLACSGLHNHQATLWSSFYFHGYECKGENLKTKKHKHLVSLAVKKVLCCCCFLNIGIYNERERSVSYDLGYWENHLSKLLSLWAYWKSHLCDCTVTPKGSTPPKRRKRVDLPPIFAFHPQYSTLAVSGMPVWWPWVNCLIFMGLEIFSIKREN